ncbi:MAG: DNA-3-methyladenine glycosylase [Phycisphaerales bacterium]|nr:DNA-3-methyladenine glycosylase [Phycisphaerales bacterium]
MKPPAARFLSFGTDPVVLARRLLGQRLVRIERHTRLAGRIVEVEAYLGPQDRAAHTFGGRRTARNASMWLAGGHAYVYFTYGMHWCLNVVAGAADEGVAVLVRAIEPEEGVEAMVRHRRGGDRRLLAAGPARLTQALAIDGAFDGEDLRTSDRLFIERVLPRALPARRIAATPRIGVAYAGEWAAAPLRFCVADSPGLSRRLNAATCWSGPRSADRLDVR